MTDAIIHPCGISAAWVISKGQYMTISEIKKMTNAKEYDFLRTNPHLGKNVILLGLGGSYAYGTNVETSDVDIRGCALNSKSEILTGTGFEQVTNEATDTTVYSFNKLIHLLSNANPNVIEILGLRPEHYIYLSPVGQELLNNKKLFLSKKCVYSFGGYANQQLYRLQQKSKQSMKQSDLEKHILKTLEHMQDSFNDKYADFPDDGLTLYIDKSCKDEMDTEIFMDVKLSHYPLRDYLGLWNSLQTTAKSYNSIGRRNEAALAHAKIGKHSMHLVRLYHMCLDLLEKGEVVTYREKDHDLLMDIRNGKYMTEDNQIRPEFFELVDDLEKRLDYAKENTGLPEKPDMKKIAEFQADINERIVRGDI